MHDKYDDSCIWRTLKRDGLKQLSADIEDDLTVAAVVFEIHPLLVALMAISKLVELFDCNCLTFRSFTQSFNTNTLMERLTQNILICFAHVERKSIRLASSKV